MLFVDSIMQGRGDLPTGVPATTGVARWDSAKVMAPDAFAAPYLAFTMAARSFDEVCEVILRKTC